MASESMYDPTEVPADRYQRTIPWMKDELIVINGMKLVYTKLSGDYLVHFPGGAQEYLTALQRREVAVGLPRLWREKTRSW